MPTPITNDITLRGASDSALADSDITQELSTKVPEVPVLKSASITSALVFQVDRVEKIEVEDGELDWYRYVLKNRTSTINGQRRGSYQCICDYAAEYAEQLNARIVFNPPKWQPRGSKVARTP